MKTKRLGYAYATSPFADKHNKSRGCWHVDIDGEPVAIFSDGKPWDESNKWKAYALFKSIDLPVCSSSFTLKNLPFRDYNSHEVAKKIAQYAADCSRILNG